MVGLQQGRNLATGFFLFPNPRKIQEELNHIHLKKMLANNSGSDL